MPTPPAHPALTVATINVNGIRAAVRRGMGAWLEQRRPDVITLQEVRAGDDVLVELLESAFFPGWHLAHSEPTDAGSKGSVGVASLSSAPTSTAVTRALPSGHHLTPSLCARRHLSRR